jgi:hypothetical protein
VLAIDHGERHLDLLRRQRHRRRRRRRVGHHDLEVRLYHYPEL